MANGDNLRKAKKEKNDEFYTQISDIENELKHYKEHFKDAVVFCNCDDPTESNFWRYFHLNFKYLGLKKLITTHYDKYEPTYKIEYEGGDDNDWTVGETTTLMQNGDFRSPECIELLEEADIVVTNPPFSLFREYVAQLVEHNKKFLVIGNMNAITYKEIFPLLKDNKMWIGYGFNLSMIYKTCYSNTLESNRKYVISKGYDPDKGYVKVPSVAWFTNLEHNKRYEELDLVERYDSEKYPKYDNYDAIEVNKVANIPIDYNGIMGVPITFLDKHNPEQFKILGITDRQNTSNLRTKKYTINDSKKFNDLNARSVIKLEDGTYKPTYARILIRRKDVV